MPARQLLAVSHKQASYNKAAFYAEGCQTLRQYPKLQWLRWLSALSAGMACPPQAATTPALVQGPSLYLLLFPGRPEQVGLVFYNYASTRA